MKKYILLGIPIIYYRHSILYFNLEEIINLIIVLTCLFFLLKHTIFRNVFDWIIGICFTLYFCLLYYRTIYFRGFIFENYHYSTESLVTLFHTVNLIPIQSIIIQLSYHPSALYQIFGNTIMLTPFVFAMLYFKWVRSYWRVIWYSFICTVGIEFIQFLQNLFHNLFVIGLRRSVDIDDIILNTISAVIGIGCYILWTKIHTRFQKRTPDI